MAIESGSAFRHKGVPIPDSISSGSDFTVELMKGPGYMVLESKRDSNGRYIGPGVFAAHSSSNLNSTVFSKHVIGSYMGANKSGSLTFTAAHDVEADTIFVRVASPVQNIQVDMGGGVEERFVISVKTDNAGTSEDNEFTLPWVGTYDVDWGDGVVETGLVDTQTHTYPSAGTYDVKVTAATGRIYFNNSGDKIKVIDIKNWGTCAWTSMENAFKGCKNILTLGLNDVPDLSNVTNVNSMFQNINNQNGFVLDGGLLSQWDVSNINIFRYMFSDFSSFGNSDVINIDITNWNVSNGTDFTGMFFKFRENRSKQSIGNPSGWNTTNATSFNSMFNSANILNTNEWNFSGWNISNVTIMTNFLNRGALSVANYDATLISWASQNPTSINVNFGGSQYSYEAASARQTLIDDYGWTITDGGQAVAPEFALKWETTTPNEEVQIGVGSGTFDYVIDWGDGTVESYNTDANISHTYATAGEHITKITGDFPHINMGDVGISTTFKNKLYEILNWGDIAWDSLEDAFLSCSNLDFYSSIDSPNLQNCTSLYRTFRLCTSLGSVNGNNIDLSNWDVSNVTSIGEFVILYNTSMNLDLSGWVINANVTFARLVDRCNILNVTGWDVSNVTNFSNIFNQAQHLREITGLNTWNVSNGVNFTSMFRRIYAITSLGDLTSWQFAPNANLQTMFFASIKESWDQTTRDSILNLDVSNATNMRNMFAYINTSWLNLSNWDVSGVSDFLGILNNSTLTTQNYDETLISWAAQSLQINKSISFGNSQYTLGGAAEAARNTLINTYGWTITDGGGAFVGVLDTYPNASAAYSLRDLASASVGSAVVRVRRSSDNTEQDFTSAEITDGTLATFCSGTDGFVAIWYDQSGNSNNASTPVALQQYLIVDNGVIYMSDGKPAIVNLNSSNKFLGWNEFTAVTVISVSKQIGAYSKLQCLFSRNYGNNTANERAIRHDDQSPYQNWNVVGNTQDWFVPANGDWYSNNILKTSDYTNPDTELLFLTNAGSQTYSISRIGDGGSTNRSIKSAIQEVIIYPTDQSANRTGIETNINTEYTIYEVPVSGLLFDYPGSSAAYSLRQLTTFESGNEINLVRVRRSNDNTEQDFTATEITDGTLTTFTGVNDGFVTVWYDQSGNINNAVQVTAVNQPKLVSSGVVELDNNKPSIQYDSTGNDTFDLTIPLTDVNSVFEVLNAQVNTGNFTQFLLGNNASYNYASGTNNQILWPSIDNPAIRSGKNYVNSVPEEFTQFNRPLQQSLITMIHTSPSGRVNQLTKDRTLSGRSWRGKMQEIILYSTDETSNLHSINENLNDHYNIYEYRGNIVGGLLFDYPTSNGAYSLRNLAEYDNGFWPVIRIRRSNDNVEQDIFATDITDGTLESFIGVGNDGFVTKWYNQVPTPYGEQPNNASQTTAIKQPKLVSNGAVITDNGKPALFYGSTGTIELNLLYDFDNINSVFQVLRTTSTTGNNLSLILGTIRPTGPYNYLSGASGQWLNGQYTRAEIQNGSNYLNDSLTNMITTVRTTNQYLLSMIHTAAVGEVGSFSNDRNFNGRSWQGYMQEIILYPTDQTTNRDAIKTNINTEYDIYEPAPSEELLVDYPDASVAYSLRNLISTTTNVVRVRRSNDNTEQDFTSTEITNGTLTTFTGANDGFVTTWYDQSPNNNNLQQQTATRQPKLVDAGVVMLSNNKPTINFNSGNRFLQGFNINPSEAEHFLVIENSLYPQGYQGNTGLYNYGSGINTHYSWTDGKIYDSFGTTSRKNVGTPPETLAKLNLYNVLSKPSEWSARLNSTQFYAISSNTVGFNGNQQMLGNVNYNYLGKISEFIIYPTDQSLNRNGIETNINTEYTIY